MLSLVQLFATLWAETCQASLSMEFSRQEYWSGLPFPPSGKFPNTGIEPMSLESPALAGRFFTTSTIWEVEYFSSWQLFMALQFGQTQLLVLKECLFSLEYSQIPKYLSVSFFWLFYSPWMLPLNFSWGCVLGGAGI